MNKMHKSINDLMAALQSLSHAPDASAGLGTATGTFFYCWAHGETTGAWHTSRNCRKQKEGHKMEATFYNRMQGSNAKPPPRNK
eukprot:15036580-Ditylum_brightwellii.AAC.1